jgi:hypothetical protein
MELDQPPKGNRVKKSNVAVSIVAGAITSVPHDRVKKASPNRRGKANSALSTAPLFTSSYTASKEMEVDQHVVIKHGKESPLPGPKPRRGGGRAAKKKTPAATPYSSKPKRNQTKGKIGASDSACANPRVGKKRGGKGKLAVGSVEKVVKAKAPPKPKVSTVTSWDYAPPTSTASLEYGLGMTYGTQEEFLDAKNDTYWESLLNWDPSQEDEEEAPLDVYVGEGPSTPPPDEEDEFDITSYGKAGDSDWDMLSEAYSFFTFNSF